MLTMKPESYQDANFAITGGTGGCHCDNFGASSEEKVGNITTLSFQ